jgi:hypothetical protein
MSKENEVITHDGVDRGHKQCRCIVCEQVEICTPSWDFYCEEPGGPLKCEACVSANLKAIGLNLGGNYYKLEKGMRVKVIQGLLEGEDGVVRAKGRFPTMAGTKSPPTVMVDFPSKVSEDGVATLGKLAGDLEILP